MVVSAAEEEGVTKPHTDRPLLGKKGRPPDALANWQAMARDAFTTSKTSGEACAALCELLPQAPTIYGCFLRDLSAACGTPPSDTSSQGGSTDLYPISVSVGKIFAKKWQQDQQQRQQQQQQRSQEHLDSVVTLMIMALNWAALAGWEETPIHYAVGATLTAAQCAVVTHLCEAAQQFLAWDRPAPSLNQILADLRCSKVDYAGEAVSTRRQLVAAKAIPPWPAEGKAAQVPVLSFLEGELWEDIRDPSRCLRPQEEWPEYPPSSRVHADDSEWYKLCKVGLQRGIFGVCPASRIFRDHNGVPVLNGAMGVDKYKEVDGKREHHLRFISILCPINAYLRRLRGDSHTLPYLGQASLILLEEDEVLIDDGADMEGCFNIFYLPDEWLGYFCFEKQVPASVIGGNPNDLVYISIRTVPMGWLSAVDLMQPIARKLVFDHAGVPPETEIRTDRELPPGPNYSLICLDGFDYLQRLKAAVAAVQIPQSREHRAFEAACGRWNIPLNASKRLIGALEAGVLGGMFLGERGWLSLGADKSHSILWRGLGLLSMDTWTEGALRHWGGNAAFAAQFRRPVFSILQSVFTLMPELAGSPRPPSRASFDEVLVFTSLLPLCYTNLRAPLRRTLSCTDASEEGGGACEAKLFVPQLDRAAAAKVEACYAKIAEESALPLSPGLCCSHCHAPFASDSTQRAPCAAQCGALVCSIDCHLRHRRSNTCPFGTLRLPGFAEGFSGPKAKLTWAVCRGGVEICLPLDRERAPFPDILQDSGRQHVQLEFDNGTTAWEHWGPECKLMSRARGWPILLADGSTIPGPPAVRNEYYVMGLPGLRGNLAKKVEASNAMACLSLRRLDWRIKNWGLGVIEHPVNSWLWQFPLAVRLANLPGVYFTILWHQDFGGLRCKGTGLLHNCQRLHQALHTPHRPSAPAPRDYQATRTPDGSLLFDTAEEAEYPELLCLAYAKVVCHVLHEFQANTLPLSPAERPEWVLSQLAKSTKRLSSGGPHLLAAKRVLDLLATMQPGDECQHLHSLLRLVDYRGADVRLDTGVSPEGRQELPYPAFAWQWRTSLAYEWRHTQHINVLEFISVLNYIRSLAASTHLHGLRYLHVLDSRVTAGVLARGRSSSRRLNRPCRRLTAYVLGMDVYLMPLWTISQWMAADAASRMYTHDGH